MRRGRPRGCCRGAPEWGQLGDLVEPYAEVRVGVASGVAEGCAVRLEEAQRELAVVGDEPAAAADEPVAG